MQEPSIPKAPDPCPIGWGWDLMARNAERAGWTDRVDEFREMARKSREAGRDLVAGEATDGKETQAHTKDEGDAEASQGSANSKTTAGPRAVRCAPVSNRDTKERQLTLW